MDWFINRKAAHVLVGILLTILIYYDIVGPLYLVIVIISGTILSIYHKFRPIRWVRLIFHLVDHKNDIIPGMGALTFVLGVLALLVMFGNSTVTLGSIMVLTFGDSFASLIGRWLNKQKIQTTKLPINKKKTLEATVSGTLVAILAALIFVPLLQAVSGAAAGMAIEGLEIKIGKYSLDDNFFICIASGLAMAIVARLGGV